MSQETIKNMFSKLDTMLELDEGIAVNSVEELTTKYNEFVEEYVDELISKDEQPLMLETQLTDIEDNGSGLTSIPWTDEGWEKTFLEKPHYSDNEFIQKKFEFAVKYTGMGRVLSALCEYVTAEHLKPFIDAYFENNQLWTEFMED